MTSFDYRLNPIYTIKECSFCGALYTTDYCCSNGSLVDKIICDLNKAPDSPHLHMFSSNQRHCFHCKDVLGDGEFCQRCTCKSCGKGAHIGYNFPPKVPVISNPEPCKNQTIDELPQTLPSFHPTCYFGDESPFTCDSTPNIVDDSPNVFNPPPQPPKYSYEFCENDAYYGYDCPPQVPFTYDPEPCYNQDFNFPQNSQNFQQHIFVVPVVGARKRLFNISICFDDDEDYTIAITPKEPDNSLSMRDKHLDTIPAIKSDEFIKSSVQNLVPNPSESKGEHECDVPACDDFTTFSNLLFDVDDDFSSSDDESFSDEDISKKIYSNPLFDEEIISIMIDPHHFNAESDLIESLLNHDSSIISSSLKIDYLLDKFADELILLKSIPPGIDKADCDPEEEIRLDERLLYDAIIESFSPSLISVEDSDPLIEEIDLFLASDGSIPHGIDNDYSDT
uniref:Pre-mRNA splicing Prp18-interacting factor n=1 Tax=Tanacetum cinerariifolium TaxID=118510 RepID=A0A699H9A3_TANCI|nr:hypothetical protein [Tanacetum cinerariifolium]